MRHQGHMHPTSPHMPPYCALAPSVIAHSSSFLPPSTLLLVITTDHLSVVLLPLHELAWHKALLCRQSDALLVRTSPPVRALYAHTLCPSHTVPAPSVGLLAPSFTIFSSLHRPTTLCLALLKGYECESGDA